jgi:hypothetical protein
VVDASTPSAAPGQRRQRQGRIALNLLRGVSARSFKESCSGPPTDYRCPQMGYGASVG